MYPEEMDITPAHIFVVLLLFSVFILIPITGGLMNIEVAREQETLLDAFQSVEYYFNDRRVPLPIVITPRVYEATLERRIRIENPTQRTIPITVEYDIPVPLYTRVLPEVAPTELAPGSNYFVTYVYLGNSTISFREYNVTMWVRFG